MEDRERDVQYPQDRRLSPRAQLRTRQAEPCRPPRHAQSAVVRPPHRLRPRRGTLAPGQIEGQFTGAVLHPSGGNRQLPDLPVVARSRAHPGLPSAAAATTLVSCRRHFAAPQNLPMKTQMTQMRICGRRLQTLPSPVRTASISAAVCETSKVARTALARRSLLSHQPAPQEAARRTNPEGSAGLPGRSAGGSRPPGQARIAQSRPGDVFP